MPSSGRLSNAIFSALVVSSAIAIMASCGFRTDPNSGALICVDANDGTETGDFEPGTCGNPILMEVVEGRVARGYIGGCSETEGFCDASGGEQVFKIIWPGVLDITLNFNPSATEINPIMRIVEVPSGDELPCDTSLEAVELTCGPIVTEIPGRSFYTRGGYDYYVIIDSENGEAGEYEFQMVTGWQATGTACLEQAEVEPIVLGFGGLYGWTATLPEGHGLVGSGGDCIAPGAEDVFALQILEPGYFHVNATATDGGPPPVLSLRTSGCGGANQVACAKAELGVTVNQLDKFFEGPANWYLVVDNTTDQQRNYTFEAWLD